MQNTLVLALHGFLGEGSDWDRLRSQTHNLDWTTPNLFLDEDISLSSFDDITESLISKIQNSTSKKKVFIGYSMGGRIGLHLLKKYSALFDQFIFLSTHPGLPSEAEKALRRQGDLLWVERLQNLPWIDFLSAWNQQPVFKSSFEPKRLEPRFQRERLVQALTTVSLAEQQDMRAVIESHRSKVRWVVGDQDLKFVALAHELEQKKILSGVERISSGHRILFDSNIQNLVNWF